MPNRLTRLVSAVHSPRILILGGPRTGKTTLAKQLARDHGIPARHTDDLIHACKGWSDVSATVAREWMAQPGPWCIEGTRAVHSLRKWVAENPGKRLPVDLVVAMLAPRMTLEPGQAAFAKGIARIWVGLERRCRLGGVRVVASWRCEVCQVVPGGDPG